MDIYLDRQATRQIKLSAEEAIEEGDTDTLREDIMEAFTEEQIEEVERRVESSDFFEMLTDMLDDWSGDDVFELFDLLEAQLAEASIDFKFHRSVVASNDDEDVEDDDEEEVESADEEGESDSGDPGIDMGRSPLDEDML